MYTTFLFIFSSTANFLHTVHFFWQYIIDAEAVLVISGKYFLPGAHIVDFLPFRMSIRSHSYAFVFCFSDSLHLSSQTHPEMGALFRISSRS